MRLKKLLSFCITLLLSLNAFAQHTIKGKILNPATQEPIPYANIGLQKHNVGTISNPDGSFALYVPASLLSDTLVVSSIGFGTKRIAIQYLLAKKTLVIYLTEKTATLAPVTVSSKKEKPKTFELGNPDFKGGVLQNDTLYAGRSIALLIDNKEPDQNKSFSFPAFIEKARLRIFRNNLKSFKFRIRLNEVNDATGQPGQDLLAKSIVMESSMRNGWLEFNLSDLNLEIDKPFFITFEQLLDLQDRTLITNDYNKFILEHPNKIRHDTVEFNGKKEVRTMFTGVGIDLAGVFIGIVSSQKAAEQYTCYVRETSFGEWKKVRGIVAATVTLSKYPDLNTDKALKNNCNNEPVCKAEKIITDFIDETGINGVQLSVSKNNKTVWSGNFGYADIVNKISVTDSTKFRINSISKSMTSLALLKLMAKGKLDLDLPIQNYIPEFPKKPFPITTRQLAGHLAGFRDYAADDLNDYIRTEHYDNSIQATKIFENDTLLFKPGEKFSYSTFGWNLIGAIIEKISGKDYLTYMRENIWKPLGLKNTCGDNTKNKISNRSKFYDATGEENDLGDLSYKYAGGGLLSTSNDLVKLGNEILYGPSIDKKLKNLLFQTQYSSDKKETGYGLGWYTGKDKNGHRIWYHAGDSFSGSSYLLIYPDDNMVVSFLANSQIGTTFNIEKIGEVFYQK
jgi:serine beta-lactamase-like protein LACTB